MKDAPSPVNLKVVWLENEVTLDEALSKAGRFEGIAKGLACGKRGLGVRVPEDKFEEVLFKFLGPIAGAKEMKKQGQDVYEISKAPPWVDFDDLQSTLRNTWKWEIDPVRCFHKWNTKTFLVRSSAAPPQDSCVVQGHILLVQAAPPLRQKVQVQRRIVKSESPKPTIAKSVSGSAPTKPTSPASNSDQAARLDRIEKMMATIMTEMRSRFNETQQQLDEIRLLDYEEECDEDEGDEDNISDEELVDDVEEVVRSFTEPTAKKTKKLKKHPSASWLPLGAEPENFRVTGFAGQRVGEASNPGSQLRITTANVTSLLSHLPYVTSLDTDILALQEVRLTIDGQVMIQEYLKECGWTPLWGKPQPVRPGTRLSVLDAKQGGVGICVRSRHLIAPTPRSTLGEELYQTRRWQSAVVRVSGSSTLVHVVSIYGFPRANEGGEAMGMEMSTISGRDGVISLKSS